MTLAETILARRTSLGLTQVEAAAHAGTTQAYWSQLESGDRQPSLPMLRLIAHALKTTPAELLTES